MSRPNREDVARLAGVSTAVVSYVMNDGPRPVSEATRTRVRAAMAQLNYRPNANARALKLSKTYVLGLLITDITNPYYSEFAQTFQGLAHDAGYALMLANTGYDGAEESAALNSLLAREVDGIAAYVQQERSLDVLESSSVRAVSMDWHISRNSVPSVAVDAYGAARDAIAHLQGHGHRRIGLIGGLNGLLGGLDNPTMRDQAWLDEVGPVLGAALPDYGEWGEFTRAGGYTAAMSLFDRPKPPTALFVASDVQAIGALQAAYERGLTVPDRLAVVSIDGTVATAYTAPPLTAVQVPFEVLAQQALRKLIEPEGTFELHTTVPHRLAVRRSCGCPPAPSA